jgi:uncharacterized membrane protein
MPELLGGCCGDGGRLVWMAPAWWPALAAVGALVALGLAMRPWPREPRRWAEVALLTVALALVVAASGDPRWVQEGERTEKGRFVVLVDASRSMGVLEDGGEARGAEALALLSRFPGAEVYGFGEQLRPGAPQAFADGDSDLGGALAAVAQRYAGERLEGVAVLSDGLDRGGLRRRLTEDPNTALPDLRGPLTVYQLGRTGERTDVAITDLRGGAFAFRFAETTLEVDVQATGTPRASVPVTLTRDGRPAGTQTATLDAQGRGTAVFRITPQEVGRFLYEASVPVTPDDAAPANNTLSHAMGVVRDNVRVLQVTGSPSLDEKFLRLFLKEDPSVDLVSFFILRTQRDMNAGWDPDELSLIQFPYERLFSKELETFDLVILQNFDYAPYFDFNADELLGNIATYVRGGGALVMIGGDRSFDLGKYQGTPIEDVLPVRLGAAVNVDEAGFAPRLTAAGARHPVTALAEDAPENAAIWERLPEMDGLNVVTGARPGAAVLLEHPRVRDADGRGAPVLAVAEVDKGRSMALTVDASWRWGFDEAGAGHGNQAYLRFWKNALRWLVGDPADLPVTVETTRENYTLGEEVQLRVQARDVAFTPVPGARVTLTIHAPDGDRAVEAVADAGGVAVATVKADVRGAWRVAARAEAAGGPLGEAATVFAVTTRDPELEELEPDEAFLKALAARAGGRYVAPGEGTEPLRDPESGRVVKERAEVALAGAPIVPLLVLLCAGGAWVLRRRSGLR